VRAGGDHDRRGVIEVWDIHRRMRLWSQSVTDGSPRSVALSPDAHQVAIGTMRGNVDFRDGRTGHLLHRLSGLGDVIRCVRFSPNGRVLVVAGGAYDTRLALFNTTTYRKIASCQVTFSGEEPYGHNWSQIHPDWFTVLPDLSYIASPGFLKKITTPGRAHDATLLALFSRPWRVRDALRLCYTR
jgi:WD40 repeat protein